MKKRQLFLCLLCLLVCFTTCAAQEVPVLEEPAGVQLNAVRAYIGELSEISVFEGSVIAYAEEFYFEQEGVVAEMHVVIGQRVSAGDPLITLNTEAEEKRLQSLDKEIERLLQNGEYDDRLAQLDMAMLELELQELMSRTPRDENAEMLKKLDMEELQLKTALNQTLRQMTLSELESERERLLEEVSRNVLYAPFDGRVMYMTSQLQRGSYVSAYTPLLYLADDTRLLVECEYITNAMLDTAHELYALVGDGKYAVTPVEVDQREYLSKVLAGEELRLQFTFDQQDETLAPGQYAAVCVENSYVADALLIPTNALYAADGSLYVYVMENGVRVRRDVKRGAATDWLTQIVEGLEEGELVYVKE